MMRLARTMLTVALIGTLAVLPGMTASAAEKAWDLPTTISVAGQNAYSPQVVTDGTTITITWNHFDGTNYGIQTASSTDAGATWSTPTTLSTPGQDASELQAVTDGTTITVTWSRFDGTTDVIQTASSTDAGATWSAPTTLSTPGQRAYSPQIVTDGTTITVTWRRFDGTNYGIQTASSTDVGATWSTPTTLSTPGQRAYSPQIVADGTTITVTWQCFDGTTDVIQVSTFTRIPAPTDIPTGTATTTTTTTTAASAELAATGSEGVFTMGLLAAGLLAAGLLLARVRRLARA
ncbi:sialidase family protein [Cryobacterium aureum]|uniref:sialidase family protein n=1 Tax=Cryobacterium aureum TaxID=995037 RepID=UPI000CF3D33A|nr:sialidase family protein [Cryobacterium aureum]